MTQNSAQHGSTNKLRAQTWLFIQIYKTFSTHVNKIDMQPMSLCDTAYNEHRIWLEMTLGDL